MGQTLRVRLLCEEALPWRARLEAGLRAQNVQPIWTSDESSPSPPPVTLILFDRLTPEVLAAVAGESAGGRARTIGAGTTREALGQGAWSLLRAGASDAFAWDEVGDAVGHVAARLQRWAHLDRLIDAPELRGQLVGQSPSWLRCLRQIVETAVFSDGPVLLLGESGTGKELLARLIHALDSRADKGSLIVLDCTTVVAELSGSEFFGHERGAFTGAAAAREGAFALADRGTLFLDEVGELPPTLQAQLLRVVQERTYKRVGSNAWQRTNFRLVCATHRDLRRDVETGRFRSDLYHRVASRICCLPPLRERRDDILPLVRQFLNARGSGSHEIGLDRAVASFLTEREYPGNIRELRQLVERMGDRHVGPGPLTLGDIPETEWANGTGTPLHEHRGAPGDESHEREEFADPTTRETVPSEPPGDAAELFETAVREALAQGLGLRDVSRAATEAAIRLALAGEAGNLQKAAKRLGVTDRALQMRRAQRPDS